MAWIPTDGQSGLGDCVAEATCHGMEFLITKQGMPPVVLSSLFTFQMAMFINGWWVSRTFPDIGLAGSMGLREAQAIGICPATYWPFDTNQLETFPPPTAFAAATYRLDGFTVVDSSAAIVAAIASGHPVMMGCHWYDMDRGNPTQSDGLLRGPDSTYTYVGDHAVTIFDYDDATRMFSGANSMGGAWGDGGWFHISYNELDDATADPLRGATGGSLVLGNLLSAPVTMPRTVQEALASLQASASQLRANMTTQAQIDVTMNLIGILAAQIAQMTPDGTAPPPVILPDPPPVTTGSPPAGAGTYMPPATSLTDPTTGKPWTNGGGFVALGGDHDTAADGGYGDLMQLWNGNIYCRSGGQWSKWTPTNSPQHKWVGIGAKDPST